MLTDDNFLAIWRDQPLKSHSNDSFILCRSKTIIQWATDMGYLNVFYSAHSYAKLYVTMMWKNPQDAKALLQRDTIFLSFFFCLLFAFYKFCTFPKWISLNCCKLLTIKCVNIVILLSVFSFCFHFILRRRMPATASPSQPAHHPLTRIIVYPLNIFYLVAIFST